MGRKATNTTTARAKAVKDIYSLHHDHGMGYQQIADKYDTTVIKVMSAMVIHKKYFG